MRTENPMSLLRHLIIASLAASAIACNGENSHMTGHRRAAIEQIDPLISWSAEPEIFPSSWLGAPFHQAADPIDPAEKARARKIVRRALSKYPASLVSRTISPRKIYVLGELRVYRNLRFSGTASHKAVYLVVGDKSKGYTDEFVESVFHQEYSTLLMNRFLEELDQDAWKAANPEGFAYLGANSWDRLRAKDGGAKAITKSGGAKLLKTDKARLKQGFLVRYSTSSLENDVNAYASALFTNTPEFWENVDKHAAIRKKAELAIRFYNRIDPAFTMEFFRNLR